MLYRLEVDKQRGAHGYATVGGLVGLVSLWPCRLLWVSVSWNSTGALVSVAQAEGQVSSALHGSVAKSLAAIREWNLIGTHAALRSMRRAAHADPSQAIMNRMFAPHSSSAALFGWRWRKPSA